MAKGLPAVRGARVKPCRPWISSTVAGPCNKCRTRESLPCACGAAKDTLRREGYQPGSAYCIRLLPWGVFRRGWKWAREVIVGLEGDAIVAKARPQQTAHAPHPKECSWGLILAMVCMMRAGPARFPLVLPDASSIGAPVVAVERSRGSNLPRRSTRSRSGRFFFASALCSAGTAYITRLERHSLCSAA